MAARLRRVFAPLTLALFVCTLALPLLPGAHVTWDDDEDGAPGIAAEHHPVTGIGTPAAPVADAHCALCHWQHALAGATVAEIVVAVPGFVPAELFRQPLTAAPAQPAPSGAASRAPPALA